MMAILSGPILVCFAWSCAARVSSWITVNGPELVMPVLLLAAHRALRMAITLCSFCVPLYARGPWAGWSSCRYCSTQSKRNYTAGKFNFLVPSCLSRRLQYFWHLSLLVTTFCCTPSDLELSGFPAPMSRVLPSLASLTHTKQCVQYS